MNNLFMPYDVAMFLVWADFPMLKEEEVRREIWKFRKISRKYTKNEKLFNRDIDRCLEKIENLEYFDEVEVINKVLLDIGSNFTIDDKANEQATIDSYFKLVKLKLIYGEKEYIKIKTRTLLKQFKYKRRQQKFIENLKSTMYDLGIGTYLKNCKKCDIARVNLDAMVMMRLR